MMKRDTLLSVEHLSVSFGKRAVLSDVSFDVARGDSLAIIEPNGCGKTVLLKALLNLIPCEGRITWDSCVRLAAAALFAISLFHQPD